MWQYNYTNGSELYHYGIKGMKWGKKKASTAVPTTTKQTTSKSSGGIDYGWGPGVEPDMNKAPTRYAKEMKPIMKGKYQDSKGVLWDGDSPETAAQNKWDSEKKSASNNMAETLDRSQKRGSVSDRATRALNSVLGKGLKKKSNAKVTTSSSTSRYK